VLGDGCELLHRLAFGGQLEAGFLAGFGFTIESLRHCGGAAHFAEDQNFNLKFAAFVANREHVTHAHFAGGLGLDAVGMDAAEVAGPGGQSTGLEEARRPEPLVDAY